MSNISPLAYVDPSAKIGENVTIHPFAYIDCDVEIGDGCEIMPYASIIRGTRMGRNNKVYQGSIIGADPQDFRWKGEKTFCELGNDNIIREHVIINRSIREGQATRIGSRCFIMAECHIGHDTFIKGRCVLGNGVTIAGDAVVDECTILSSNAMVHEGCHVAQWVMIKGGCRIGSNVPPYVVIAHNPAVYSGTNAYIMRSKGFTEDQIDDIASSYRHLYQSGSSVFNAMKRIEADVEPSEIRDHIVNFIRDHNLKIVGTRTDI